MTGAALESEKQIVRWSERNESSVAVVPGAQRFRHTFGITKVSQAGNLEGNGNSALHALLRESGQLTSATWRSEPHSTGELGFGIFSFFGPGPGLLTPNSSEIAKFVSVTGPQEQLRRRGGR